MKKQTSRNLRGYSKIPLKLALNLLLLLFTIGCNDDKPSQTGELSKEEKDIISAQITQTVNNYLEAVKSNNIEKILTFWGNTDDFVHAGDGSIFGGYEKWSSYLKGWTNIDRKWLYWNNKNIHVIVLDKNAAAYTTNFETASVFKEDTTKVKGSWTYVFRKEESGWKVITSNGMHTGFSYED